jgi:hypothetical protein
MKPTTITLFESPEQSSFAELEKRELTTLFAAGIVNPFGPTLTVAAAQGVLETDKQMPIVRMMLNPFSHECDVMGKICIGETFDPRKDLPNLFPLVSGGCPTLLLPASYLGPDIAVDFYAQLLRSFADGTDVLSKVRRYPQDPWSRIQEDVDGLADMMERAASGRGSRPAAKHLNDTEARELAASLLDPTSLKAELQAFLFAWKGALEFQGSSDNDAIAGDALSFEDFVRVFAVIAVSCRHPDLAE